MIDLHSHTCYSDGSLTPEELVSLAVSSGLTALAVTDHDTALGVPRALAAAEGTPLEVIPGIEVSTDYRSLELHLVGLYIDYDDPDFLAETAKIAAARSDRGEAMARLLAEHGIPVTLGDVLAHAGKEDAGVITRAHFGRYLYEMGYVSSIKEAFEKYIGEGCPCYVPWKRMTPQEGVAFIRRYHGIPIMAHPLKYGMDDEELGELVGTLKDAGLTGIEVLYGAHSPEDTARALALAEKYDLMPSGGSDFHGASKPGLQLGCGYGDLAVPEEILLDLKRAHYGVDEGTRIFFSDYDGTLSRTDKTISPATLEIIDKWKAAGNRFVLSSGRPLSDLFRIWKDQLGSDDIYLSGADGADIYDCAKRRIIHHCGVPLDISRRICALAKETGVYLHAYTDTSIVCEKDCDEIRRYTYWVPLPVVYGGENFIDTLPLPPSKLLALAFTDLEKLDTLRQRINAEFEGKVSCFFSNPSYLEIVSVHAGKGKALTWLSRHLGIDPALTVAAGDSENDISMLRAAGTGIAMCNGIADMPALKEAADLITETDHDHDGLVPVLTDILARQAAEIAEI